MFLFKILGRERGKYESFIKINYVFLFDKYFRDYFFVEVKLVKF